MAPNSLFCADVPLSNYSLTHACLRRADRARPTYFQRCCATGDTYRSATSVMVHCTRCRPINITAAQLQLATIVFYSLWNIPMLLLFRLYILADLLR